MSTLLLLAWLLPLAVAPLGPAQRAAWLPAVAALPALAAGLLVSVGADLRLDWLLLGVHLDLDQTGRLFLLFSALFWLFAGIYAALTQAGGEREGGFRVCLLLGMAGNFLLILAADMVTFYVGFALMGLSAYGLVVQRRSQRARRAGRIYLAWTLAGEVALFSALVLLAEGADSLRFADLEKREMPEAAVALLLFGFGIKLALPGLHVWLPLAYSSAPPVGAAVLSGPMINAGLLGWLRFLPPGAPGVAAWSDWLVILGIAGVALGVVAGVAQRDPRAVLGYSSIAKTGLMATVFGTALAHPSAAPAILSALVLFAMHHLLVKGTLFLGLGEWERAGPRPWVLAVLGILALAMAGTPLTGGAAAKAVMSDALDVAGVDLGLLLGLSAAGTALLMVRFFWLTSANAGRPAPGGFGLGSLSWLIAAALALWLPFRPAELPFSSDGLIPLAAGLALAALLWLAARLWALRLRIPPGDILHLLPGRRLRRFLHCAPRRIWEPSERSAKLPFSIGGATWFLAVLGVAGILASGLFLTELVPV